MKKFTLSITVIILFAGQLFSQGKTIGRNVDGKYAITVNNDSLIKVANMMLKKQNITANLTTVCIKEDVVKNTTNKYYYVLFTNSENTIKVAQLLVFDGGQFKTVHNSLEAGETVTCSGCRKGCDPKRYIDKDLQIEFYCSDCTLGSTSDCKKTVTQSALD
jgi:hypothetical protein